MVAIYVVYADVFYLMNLLMNVCILSITMRINRYIGKKRLLRIIIAGSIGSLLESLAVFLIKEEIIYLLIAHFVVIPCMTGIAFGGKSVHLFFQNALICYGVTIFLAGSIEFVENTFRITNLTVLISILVVMVSEVILQRFFRYMQKEKRYVELKMCNGDTCIHTLALLDSGNLLLGPDKKTPVHFVDTQILEQLIGDESGFVGYVEYQTMSKETNVAKVYQIKEMKMKKGGGWITIKCPLVTAARTELFVNRQYHIILNSRMEDV